MKKPLTLIIMDGFGINEDTYGNAIDAAVAMGFLLGVCEQQSSGIGGGGFMEYYVQRHGNEAAFAYSLMATALIAIVLLTLVIRAMGGFAGKKKALAEAVTEENAAVETV